MGTVEVASGVKAAMTFSSGVRYMLKTQRYFPLSVREY
jgi:hypothetical protein